MQNLSLFFWKTSSSGTSVKDNQMASAPAPLPHLKSNSFQCYMTHTLCLQIWPFTTLIIAQCLACEIKNMRYCKRRWEERDRDGHSHPHVIFFQAKEDLKFNKARNKISKNVWHLGVYATAFL